MEAVSIQLHLDGARTSQTWHGFLTPTLKNICLNTWCTRLDPSTEAWKRKGWNASAKILLSLPPHWEATKMQRHIQSPELHQLHLENQASKSKAAPPFLYFCATRGERALPLVTEFSCKRPVPRGGVWESFSQLSTWFISKTKLKNSHPVCAFRHLLEWG